MTSKKGTTQRGIESDIEKSREDGRWQRVIELADSLKHGSPKQGK